MKRNPLHVFFLALFVAFFTMGAGCQSGGGSATVQQQVAGSCLTAAAALDALTIANDAGKLSESQQRAVTLAEAKISIVCLDDTPPTLDSLRQAVLNEAILSLTNLKETTR